ncbi:MAG: type II secretion system major pseudopilin GspG [Verrucomicrobia bacterium]|nr:type II secretion system major pseudopilin GspG [Verrucomicrobiota bacterium]
MKTLRHPPSRLRLVRSATRGFTMMELLVVLAILGLLAGLAISNVGNIFGDAQGAAAKLFVKESMKTSLFSYRMSMGDYPSTADGLQALVTAPGNKGASWRGPYIDGGKVPLDPWNEPYQYAYPGSKNKSGYDLWSKGPDKQSGTADDIGNWDDATSGSPK